jgi:hypothetical protein
MLAAAGLAWLAFADTKQRRPTARMSGRTAGTGADVRAMAQRGRSRVECMLRDYPLAVGAAAMILGTSLGLAVPETEAENEMMGEARDSTLQRAQAAASSAVGQAKEAAADVVTRAAMGD